MNTNNILKASEQKFVIEDVTPQMALDILEMNTGNFRRIDKNRVQMYSSDMVNGKWEMTGDTIKISNGNLLDGQHRLLAIIKAGKTIRCAFAINIAESAINIDKGKPRTVTQWLAHIGIANSNASASCSRLIVMHDKGMWSTANMQLGQITDREVIEYAKKHDNAIQAAIHVASKSKSVCPGSVAAAMVHLGSGRSVNPESIDLIQWFWTGVATGSNLEQYDPPLALRNRLLDAKSSPSKRLTPPFIRWICSVAWNGAVLDKPVKKNGLFLRLTGPTKQAIPNEVLVAGNPIMGCDEP